MAMLTIVDNELPDGSYVGKFLGAEPFKDHISQFGEATFYRFEIVEGAHRDQHVGRVAKNKGGRGSALAQMVSGLTGKCIESAMRISTDELEDYRGKLYRIDVRQSKGGKPRVEAVTTYDKEDDIPF